MPSPASPGRRRSRNCAPAAPVVPFTINIPAPVHERLTRIAVERNVPTTHVIREALAAHVEREERRGGRP